MKGLFLLGMWSAVTDMYTTGGRGRSKTSDGNVAFQHIGRNTMNRSSRLFAQENGVAILLTSKSNPAAVKKLFKCSPQDLGTRLSTMENNLISAAKLRLVSI